MKTQYQLLKKSKTQIINYITFLEFGKSFIVQF